MLMLPSVKPDQHSNAYRIRKHVNLPVFVGITATEVRETIDENLWNYVFGRYASKIRDNFSVERRYIIVLMG